MKRTNNILKKYLSFFSGDSIIPLRIYWYSTPFVIAITVLIEVDLTSFTNIVEWILVSVYSIMVTAVYILFFKYVIFISAKHLPISFGQIFIYIFFLGVVKGLSTYYFSILLNLHNHPIDSYSINSHMLIRVIPAIVMAFWYVSLISWIDHTLSKYKKLRDDLITQTARLELENQSYKKLIEESKLALRKKMQSIFQEIKSELDKIQPDVSFENQWTKIADLVRNAAFYEIRPQSHSLWNSNIQKYKNLSIRFFVQSALRLNPFPWKLIIPIYFITTFPFLYLQIQNIAFSVSFYGLISLFLIYQLAIFLVNKIKNRKLLYVSLIVLISIIDYNLLDYFIRTFPRTSVISLNIAGILWLIFLNLSCSLLISFQKTKDAVLKDIQLSLNEKKLHKETLKQIERRINTKLAKFLHGNVQARLMSNALQLDLASKNNDKEMASKELAKLSQDLLNDYGIMNQFESNTSFTEAMDKIIESWAGICEIEVLGHKLLNVDKMIIKDFIEDAISESIANSVRHGMADKIKILFRKTSDNNLEISISDNGVGPIESNPGMGAEIFNILSGNNWKLIPNYSGKGSLLVLNIDLSIEGNINRGVSI